MNIRGKIVAVLLLLSTATGTAGAAEAPPPVLHPTTHTSASGVYRLLVDPSDPLGRGPASYQFSQGDKLKWSRELPFTLWEAVVADGGQIAGYAYSHGWRGFSKEGYPAGMGTFQVVLLLPEGEVLHLESHEREQSRFLHTPPNPLAMGLLLLEAEGRFAVRVADEDRNRNQEQWWAFDLATGEREDTVEPGWDLHLERERAPRSGEPSAPVFPEFPALSLRKIGAVALDTGVSAQMAELEEISGFDFDVVGQLVVALTRHGSDTRPIVRLLSADGEVKREISLPVEGDANRARLSNPASVGEGRAVVALSGYELHAQADVFLVDFEAETARRMNAVQCPAIEVLAGFPDGRFAALTVRREQYTGVSGLYFFDAEGETLWKNERRGYRGDPDELLSPKDLARLSTGQIAVLSSERIQLFGGDGAYLATMDLEQVWGRMPDYPTMLEEDGASGYWVYDFPADQPLLRLGAEGRIRTELAPRFDDGRPVQLPRDMRRAPGGELWISDGRALLRLSEAGVVEQVLGQAPSPEHLGTPAFTTLGPEDRLYVADDDTHVVHVFDGSGRHVGHCQPAPEDLSVTSRVADVAVAPSQDVYVSMDYVRDNYLHFGADCVRRGNVLLEGAGVRQRWLFQPGSGRLWRVGYEDIQLLDEAMQPVRKMQRRADGRWFETVGRGSVAPDGSLAVFAHGETSDGFVSINVFSPTGEARTTFPVPGPWTYASLAFDGEEIAVLHDDTLHVLDTEGRPLGRALLAVPSGGWWLGPHLAAGGTELWLLDAITLTLHKWAWPPDHAAQ